MVEPEVGVALAELVTGEVDTTGWFTLPVVVGTLTPVSLEVGVGSGSEERVPVTTNGSCTPNSLPSTDERAPPISE